MRIQFQNDDPERAYHTCESRREGDWIIFTCPHCSEYESRFNIKTEERISHHAEDPTVFHQGSFVPVGMEQLDYQPN